MRALLGMDEDTEELNSGGSAWGGGGRGQCRGASRSRRPLPSFSGSGNLGENSLGRAAPLARSLLRTAPLAPGAVALELQQKGPEAGPAAAAAFRERGGSGEGFAVRRWLKVPGKGFRRHSSPRLPKLGSSLSSTTGEVVGSPSARERDSAATGAEKSPQWRAGPSQAVRIPSAK